MALSRRCSGGRTCPALSLPFHSFHFLAHLRVHLYCPDSVFGRLGSKASVKSCVWSLLYLLNVVCIIGAMPFFSFCSLTHRKVSLLSRNDWAALIISLVAWSSLEEQQWAKGSTNVFPTAPQHTLSRPCMAIIAHASMHVQVLLCFRRGGLAHLANFTGHLDVEGSAHLLFLLDFFQLSFLSLHFPHFLLKLFQASLHGFHCS